MAGVGALFEGFSKVAAAHPADSWFPTARSAAELTTPTAANRMIAYPYPKFCNAVMDVDQSAAVLVMSEAEAARLGVPREKWVYLHGAADTYEYPVQLSSRKHPHRSFAMKAAAEEATAAAGVSLHECKHFEIYSCFPVAVQTAIKEMGIPFASDDGADLTVTGGLPYHGGPGNNYSMHGIAGMVKRLRANPGDFGFVTANGGFLTKHSVGIYSTTSYGTTHPGNAGKVWTRKHPATYQAGINAAGKRDNTVTVATAPEGRGTVKNWTVEYSRGGIPSRAIVWGELTSGSDVGSYFLATSSDKRVMARLMADDAFGIAGLVESKEHKPRAYRTTFTPHPCGTAAGKL